jgi:hypothetical protein
MSHPCIATEPIDGTPGSPSGPPGIDVKRVSASTLQVITYLFPKERGLALLTLLLGSAEVKRLELPDLGLVEVAVIRLQSIEVFARQHDGWSKDTALRYFAVLEALQILQRHRHADYTELHIPLVPWFPSASALLGLDALIENSREKLQQLASSVKARFLLLYGSPHSWSSLFDDLFVTLTDVQDLLNKRLSPTKRVLLQLRIENLKARLEIEVKKGDFQQALSGGLSAGQRDLGDFHARHESPNVHGDAKKGDFHSRVGGTNGHRYAEKGDFSIRQSSPNGHTQTGKGDFQEELLVGSAEKGDFYTGSSQTNGVYSAQKGDFQQTLPRDIQVHLTGKEDFQEELLVGSAEKGDFQEQSSHFVVQKGDFQGVGSGVSFNDNVITYSNDSNREDSVIDNDTAPSISVSPSETPYAKKEAAKVGRSLAMFFEHSLENVGGFVNKCKLYTPTMIRAAVIDALVHAYFPKVDPSDERGRPRSRAAWFHDACNRYAKAGAAIPAFVEKWLRTDLSWEEIEQALRDASARYSRYMLSGERSAVLVREWLRGELVDQELHEKLQIEEQSEVSHSAVQTSPVELMNSSTSGMPYEREAESHFPKTWMDEGEAEILACQILQEGAPYGFTSAVAEPVPDHGTYVVAVVCDQVSWTVKNPSEWKTYISDVQVTLRLQEQWKQERLEREKSKQGGNHGTNK